MWTSKSVDAAFRLYAVGNRQNRGFYVFFADFGLQHKWISFTRWCHATIVKRSAHGK